MKSPESPSEARFPHAVSNWLWLLPAALIVMYAPTFVDLARTIWRRDDQPPGPMILTLSIWLLYRKWPDVLASPFRPAPVTGYVVMGFGLLLYFVGRSQAIDQFEVGSLIPVMIGLFLTQRGSRALRQVWFPLFFLLFVIPLPGVFVQAITLPLKSLVSWTVEHLLHFAGYPVARAGVTLSIAQYRLLVADACAGLNSLFVLEALGLLYLNLMNHTQLSRNAILAMCIVPISFIANVVRVTILVLITYYFGDAAAQGFLHEFAGIVLFVTALMLILATDSMIGWLLFRERSARG